MPEVFNILKAPGETIVNGTARIRLIAGSSGGFVPTEDSEIIGDQIFDTNSAGRWSAILQANANIQPANTYYEVTETQPGRAAVINYFQVPAGAGPHNLYDILVTPPASLPSPHESDPSAAHGASAISFVPVGSLASTDVQAAIAEAASEAYQLSGHTLSAHDTLGLATQSELDAVSAAAVLLAGSQTITGEKTLQGATTAAEVLSARVPGDTQDRFHVLADGKMEWGPGNGAADTNLYRSAAGVLRTDGILSANKIQGTVGDSMLNLRDDGIVLLQTKDGLAYKTLYLGSVYTYAGGSVINSPTLQSPLMVAQNASYTAGIFKGAAGQSANLQEWQNSAGVVQASVDVVGRFFASDLNLQNGFLRSARIHNMAQSQFSATLISPGISNRLLGARQRHTVTYSGFGASDAPFDGYDDQSAYLAAGGAAGTITIIFQSPYTYNEGWIVSHFYYTDKPEYYKVETRIGGVWTTVQEVTGYANMQSTMSVSSLVGNYIEGIRITATSAAGFPVQLAELEYLPLRRESMNDHAYLLSSGPNQNVFTAFDWRTNQAVQGISLSVDQVLARTTQPSTTPLIVQAAASQSADLQVWKNSAGTVLARMGVVGDFVASKLAVLQVGVREWDWVALGGNLELRDEGAGVPTYLRVDASINDGDTCLLVKRNVGGTLTLQRVSMGAADSAGVGFKTLRVPN